MVHGTKGTEFQHKSSETGNRLNIGHDRIVSKPRFHVSRFTLLSPVQRFMEDCDFQEL